MDKFSKKAKTWDIPRRIEMAEAFVKEIRKNINITGLDVLEFGCGTGLVGLSIVSDVKSINFFDTSKAMISELIKKIRIIDVIKIKVHDGNFSKLEIPKVNLIISSMAFHHIKNLSKTISYFHKLLKPDGYAIIGDLVKEDGGFHAPEKTPHNGFDPEELSEMFKREKFKVLKTYKYNTISKQTHSGELKNFDQFILVAKKSR